MTGCAGYALSMEAHGCGHFCMAFPAGLVSNLKIMRFDAQRIDEIAGRERIGMPKPVRRLRCVFCDEPGGGVAIVADCDGSVTRF